MPAANLFYFSQGKISERKSVQPSQIPAAPVRDLHVEMSLLILLNIFLQFQPCYRDVIFISIKCGLIQVFKLSLLY